MTSAHLVVVHAHDKDPVAVFTHDRKAAAWIAAQDEPDDYVIYQTVGASAHFVFLADPEPKSKEDCDDND